MTTRPAIPLASLLPHLRRNARVTGSQDVAVNAIEVDSRRVQPGNLFVALRGERTDGHHFVAQAIERGAVAVVIENLTGVPAGVTAIVVPDSTRAASQLADAFFGSPSQQLRIAGVTGTNGKTTTTQMVAAMLNESGVPSGTIGTIGARFAAREWKLENTTPLAPQLHELLAQMREEGASAVAMEVSSHALALGRTADVHFWAGALTNVTRDHLDFHESFDAYAAAKRKLFDMTERCVLNADDELGARWAQELRPRKKLTTYALAVAADLHPRSVEVRPDGSSFELDGLKFEVSLPGRFNVANALCALGITRNFDIPDAVAARGLAALDRVAGRMEHVHAGGVDVIVDYAHTPDALENVLRSLREVASRRLIAVFGCGGDRDRGKRPQMGAIAARYADYTYVTSDNPRGENPQSIIEDIEAGMGAAPHLSQIDRHEAISTAIAGAREGDVILIAGKGHEDYQIIGTAVVPFDDLLVAREALDARAAARP